MKIAASAVRMSSGSSTVRVAQRYERLEAWVGQRGGGAEATRRGSEGQVGVRVNISAEARARLASVASFKPHPVRGEGIKGKGQGSTNGKGIVEGKGKADEANCPRCQGDAKLNMLITLVEEVFGRKVEIFSQADFEERLAEAESNAAEVQEAYANGGQGAGEGQQLEGWGVIYERREVELEVQQTNFQAEGVVRTADGREITFASELEMSREKATVKTFELRAGDATKLVDPLVLNYDGQAAELTNEKMRFDLNADGKEELVSFVRSGSGFLVHDKNQDGVVNNGSELFGPQSGDGFAELAAHDKDGNQWIDENDAIYEKLAVWDRGSDGTDRLRSLKAANVGAIYLGHVSTPFDLETNGEKAGVIQETGIYLKETGQAATIQHVDLAAKEVQPPDVAEAPAAPGVEREG